MKLKTQERIRFATLLGSYFGPMIISNFTNDIQVLRITNALLKTSFNMEILTEQYQERYSEEYQYIEQLYSEVITSFTRFLGNEKIEDPVAIFATFVYAYRHGYLSQDKKFYYSSHMKDLSCMHGVDVIRGEGVCRSVGSMLTDIYNCKGMDSTNLLVNANHSISHIDSLTDIGVEKLDDRTKHFVKIVVLLTSILPLANHLITDVEYNGKNYIFDPMNDGFLTYLNGNKLGILNDPSVHMKLCKTTMVISRYVSNVEIDSLKNTNNRLNMPTIDFREYREIYLDTLNFCQKNINLFEDFYMDNQSLYTEICDKANEQGSLMMRMLGLKPIIEDSKKIMKKLKIFDKI